jgi:transposase
MAAPRKYPDELRDRAVRLVLDVKDDAGSVSAACTRVGEQLGINPDTMRGWVKQVEIDAGARPGVSTADSNPPRRVADLAACKRLQTNWEFPLGQRVEPILYPGDGPWPPPRSAPRYKATPAEKAELRLAMACSEFLDQAGLHDETGGGVGVQLGLAVGDRYGAVEAAMLAAPD